MWHRMNGRGPGSPIRGYFPFQGSFCDKTPKRLPHKTRLVEEVQKPNKREERQGTINRFIASPKTTKALLGRGRRVKGPEAVGDGRIVSITRWNRWDPFFGALYGLASLDLLG